MPTSTIIGRALGALVWSATCILGAVLLAGQFRTGWTGGAPNDGITLIALYLIGAGLTLGVLWARRLATPRDARNRASRGL